MVHRRRPDGIFQTTSMVAWECLLQSTHPYLLVWEAKSVSDSVPLQDTAGAGTDRWDLSRLSGALWVWAPKTMRDIGPCILGPSPCTPQSQAYQSGCHQGSNWGSVGGFGGDWPQDQGWRWCCLPCLNIHAGPGQHPQHRPSSLLFIEETEVHCLVSVQVRGRHIPACPPSYAPHTLSGLPHLLTGNHTESSEEAWQLRCIRSFSTPGSFCTG